MSAGALSGEPGSADTVGTYTSGRGTAANSETKTLYQPNRPGGCPAAGAMIVRSSGSRRGADGAAFRPSSGDPVLLSTPLFPRPWQGGRAAVALCRFGRSCIA